MSASVSATGAASNVLTGRPGRTGIFHTGGAGYEQRAAWRAVGRPASAVTGSPGCGGAPCAACSGGGGSRARRRVPGAVRTGTPIGIVTPAMRTRRIEQGAWMTHGLTQGCPQTSGRPGLFRPGCHVRDTASAHGARCVTADRPRSGSSPAGFEAVEQSVEGCIGPVPVTAGHGCHEQAQRGVDHNRGLRVGPGFGHAEAAEDGG